MTVPGSRSLIALFVAFVVLTCVRVPPAASATADDYVDLTLEFSPAKASYYPSEEFSVEVTVFNLMPEPTIPGDPLLNWVKVLNVSARFSWMPLWEGVFLNVSGTSSWLPPEQQDWETYQLDLDVPASASARDYDYRVDLEYQVHTAWGNITYSMSESYTGFTVTRTTQTSLTIDHEFSPDETTFSPGEELTITITFTNEVPEGVSEEDVFPCCITNVSVHFSWMEDGEYVWKDFSDEERWLSPDGMAWCGYSLNLTVPEDAPEATHSYCFQAEYIEAAPWGEENRTLDSTAYSGFVVSRGSEGVLGGLGDYGLYLAVIAVALSVAALGAVLHHRRESAMRAAALGLNGNGYPVLRPVPGEEFPLESGLVYLVKEKRPLASFAMYDEAVSKGAEGMLISREHPNRLREVHPFSAKSVIWLSRRPGDDHVDPTELSLVSLKITRFVEEREKSVVLMEGLEYLITQNDFETVLRFVNHLHDFVLAHDCAIVIVVDPRVLSTRELALLERSATVVEPPEPVPEKAPEETKKAEAT